jgi:diaminobutyrate-2-oxoglutarate transaminase
MDKDLNSYHLQSNATILTEIPGPASRKLLSEQQRVEGNIVTYPRKMPIALKRAKGAIIEDVDGNRFIDFFSGCGVLNVGHSNPYVLEAVRKQQEELVHCLDFPTENKMGFIRKIRALLGEEGSTFKVSFCGPTGSDAIEAAIKLAKHATRRTGIIAFQGSYHGMTSGALSVTSDFSLRDRLGPLIPDVHFIPYSYCYRCPFKKEPSLCELECAEYLEFVLNNPHGGVAKPAAILVEPIQGEGGTIVPKEGFLKRICEIAHRHGVLVIFDEVQCGFYRTGKFLGFQHEDAQPDIITLSKGLGGIGFPISAILYKQSIEAWGPGDHIGTFRGNQVSIAAGSSALDFIEKYNLDQYVEDIGQYLLEQLEIMSADNPFIGNVRGRGLFMGIEYVRDKESRQPFPEIVDKIRDACFQKGLLFERGGHFGNVIRFIPPLIVTKEIIDNALAIFKEANRVCYPTTSALYEGKV